MFKPYFDRNIIGHLSYLNHEDDDRCSQPVAIYSAMFDLWCCVFEIKRQHYFNRTSFLCHQWRMRDVRTNRGWLAGCSTSNVQDIYIHTLRTVWLLFPNVPFVIMLRAAKRHIQFIISNRQKPDGSLSDHKFSAPCKVYCTQSAEQERITVIITIIVITHAKQLSGWVSSSIQINLM